MGQALMGSRRLAKPDKQAHLTRPASVQCDMEAIAWRKTTMIRARVHQGCVEIQDPIPEEWEGQFVKILPLTPDDPQPDLEERLVASRLLGPMEFEPGERELAANLLAERDRLSREAMQRITSSHP